MLPTTGTCAVFKEKSTDRSRACRFCSLLSRRTKASTVHVSAKRASAEPIEPPAPVINKILPEMYFFKCSEEGSEQELPANSVQMLSAACVSHIIAINIDYNRDPPDRPPPGLAWCVSRVFSCR